MNTVLAILMLIWFVALISLLVFNDRYYKREYEKNDEE